MWYCGAWRSLSWGELFGGCKLHLHLECRSVDQRNQPPKRICANIISPTGIFDDILVKKVSNEVHSGSTKGQGVRFRKHIVVNFKRILVSSVIGLRCEHDANETFFFVIDLLIGKDDARMAQEFSIGREPELDLYNLPLLDGHQFTDLIWL